MRSALRQQFLPSMLFLIAGIALALARLFAIRTPTPVVFFIAGRRYMEFSWLGVGVLVCFLYAILYWLSVKFLHVRISLGLSLLHLVVTLSAVIGLAQVHYIGVRNEQSPTSYNPTSFNATLAFLRAHSFTLFLAIVLLSSLMERRSRHSEAAQRS